MTGWGASLVGVGSVVDMLDDVQTQITSDAVYVVGTNVTYGLFLETGTSRMPAYPWARPAVEEFNRNPRRFVAENTNTSVGQAESADALVRVIALALERKMVQNVTAAGGGNRSPGTDPEHPRRETGNLAASIKAERVR